MRFRNIALTFYLGFVLLGARGLAQEIKNSDSERDSLRESIAALRSEIQELQKSVRELREEAAGFRAEANQLRSELARRSVVHSNSSRSEQANANGEQRLAKVEEDVQLLGDKVNEQQQTKVESASKYRLKLSGIVLFNLFSNRGAVDNIDNPSLAQSPGTLVSASSFGGSLRQSIIGLEAFGPRIAGARTSGDVQFDFAGGFPVTDNGVVFGLVRLRTAQVRLQWANTSIVGGQDSLFWTPLSPTSFASISAPALAYAGNLWAWVPQLRVEHTHQLSDSSSVSISTGILDGITGEPPSSTFLRSPQAGEQAGQPAYAMRTAWSHNAFGRALTLGGGAYYSRQNWGFNRHVDGWAGTADIQVPLGRQFTASGAFYRGRAIGGLGAAMGRSVVFSGDPTTLGTRVLGLNSIGGWAQLKFTPIAKLEFNGAAGHENPFAADLQRFSSTESYIHPTIARNQEMLVNVIARPRSDLVLSVEYRRLRTFVVSGTSEVANHINLSAGVLF